MTPMIQLDNLTKAFGPLRAVDNISLNVQKGEVLGFLGPNGAGKSTTMKMIAGFLSPTFGSVKVGSHDVTEQPVTIKKMIGYLPEGAPLYGEMTPKSFLKFIAEIRGLYGSEGRRLIEEAINKVDIGKVLNQTIETLSKGYKRRVGLAQAIIHDPPILILDEPTDGLDPNQKYQVRQLIRNMSADKAVIVSTHILEEVEAVCTRAIIIAHGRILVDGTPEELLSHSPLRNSLTLQLDPVDAQAALSDISRLATVESAEMDQKDSNEAEIRVFPKKNKNITLEVSAMLSSRGYNIFNLNTERGALEEVFRRVTEQVVEVDEENG